MSVMPLPRAAFLKRITVVLLSQNPLLNFNVASENRVNVSRRIAVQRGYGLIDVSGPSMKTPARSQIWS